MDYNKQKIQAIEKIKAYADIGNLTIKDICFYVLEQTGFSEKFVHKYLEESQERGFIKIDKNGIVNIPKK